MSETPAQLKMVDWNYLFFILFETSFLNEHSVYGLSMPTTESL